MFANLIFILIAVIAILIVSLIISLVVRRFGTRIIKYVVVAFIAVAALVLPGGLSEYRATYECSGVMTKAPNKSDPITLFISIRLNRWWVFWPTLFYRPFDGMLALEIPSTTAPIRKDVFGIKPFGWFLNLYLYRYPEGGADLTKMRVQGQFSNISYFLTLNISDEEIFRGTCTPKNITDPFF